MNEFKSDYQRGYDDGLRDGQAMVIVTCKAIRDERTQSIVCSKCGGGGLTIPNKGQKALRNFCPNCGAKVRDE